MPTMHAIRQRILQVIRERGRATVAELAEVLGMAPVSVRHHLDILQGDGLIRVDGVRRRSGAGRPQHVYTLTAEAGRFFPKNYEEVLHHLLDELKETLPADAMDALVHRIAQRMAATVSPEHEEEPTARLIRFLNERGYMPHLEEKDGGYVLSVINCPYADIATTHEELCRLDEYIIAHLLNLPKPPRWDHTIREGHLRCRMIIV